LYTALIQTRTSSKRLKSKVLLKILNLEIFLIVYKRTLKSKLIKNAIILTSTSKSDDIIEHICKKKNIPFFRGNLNNVLKRYYDCSKKNSLNNIVRITSDCPFIDPKIITKLCNIYKKKKLNMPLI
jgi:spore coat polysaccharide biosynthesis protein SpsF